MTIAITTRDDIKSGGKWRNPLSAVSQLINIGKGDPIMPPIDLGYEYGTGNQQVDLWHAKGYTLAPSTTLSLDLRGGLLDAEGNALNFAHVKRVVISIQNPDGTKSLRVGPQNVSNAAQLWFGGTGATVYDTVKTFLYVDEPFAGWGTTAGSADLLPIRNPAVSGDVVFGLWILGTSI